MGGGAHDEGGLMAGPVVDISELARVLGIVRAHSGQGGAVRYRYVQNWITSACVSSDGFDVAKFYEQIEESATRERETYERSSVDHMHLPPMAPV